jgi:molybdopterin-containing oxidoreductase family iron-sulfur binding subunit
MAACPYGSRSFNWKDPKPLVAQKDPTFPTRTKGVVEKCNFCAERLAQGRAPACVEASQNTGCNALMFGDLNDASSGLAQTLKGRHNIRRKPFLGTEPHVFYLI